MATTRMNSSSDSRKARVDVTRALRHSRRAGFTLIEVVCVVMIVGILSAIAIPRYGNALARYRVQTAAQRLAADLRMTRDTALQQSKLFKMVFVSGTKSSYSVAGLKDLSRRAVAAYQVDLWDNPYRATIVRMSMTGVDRLSFDGFGMPDSSAAFQLGAGSFTYTVSVDGTTGEVSIATP